MRHRTKWFSSALAMAFLAIVALCVSPAFAWSCCCGAQQTVALSASASTSAVAAVPTSSTSSQVSASEPMEAEHRARPCCDEAGEKPSTLVKAASAHQTSVASAAHISLVKKKCSCSHDDGSPIVSAVPASHSFSGLGVLAMPVRALALAFEEDARFAPCFHAAARPRSPGWRSSSGRGPPVFSS